MELPWHQYLMGILYILAGLNHFRIPRMYIRIIPPVFPSPKVLNAIAGFGETILGILLLLPAISQWAAWGIIALLIAIFPANVYMYIDDKASLKLPKWLRFIRLPMQVLLILWAWLYT